MFQGLFSHYQPFAPFIISARPLEELLPEATAEIDQRLILEQQIARLVPLISRSLFRAGLNTGATRVTHEKVFNNERQAFEHQRVERHIDDIIGSWYEMQANADAIGLIMRKLEAGIGLYEARKRQAFMELFYPTTWIAFLLRLPISILEKAGLASAETSSLLVKGYMWVIRVCVLLLLISFTAKQLGIPIPWKEVLTHILPKL